MVYYQRVKSTNFFTRLYLHDLSLHSYATRCVDIHFLSYQCCTSLFRDIVLSVRSLNTRAIEFYKKYGFIKVSDIEWGKTKQVKGEVYLLEQKPLYRYKENKFV